MTKKVLLVLIAMILVTAVAAWAQETGTTVPVNETTAQEILQTGILGLGVLALTEMIKRLLKWEGNLAYVISAVVSAAATAVYMIGKQGFNITGFLILTVLVFMIANGLYKTIAKT